MRNDDAVSGFVAGIFMLIILVVGAVSFYAVTSEFNSVYDGASIDPVNSTGILVNNTTAYSGVLVISKGIQDNIPITILVAFLLAVILLVFLIWAMMKDN